MMPLQYLPHLANSNGYVSTSVVEQMWKDKFMWLWENSEEVAALRISSSQSSCIPTPVECAYHGHGRTCDGLAEELGDSVEFCTHEEIAREWLAEQRAKAGDFRETVFPFRKGHM